MMVSEMLYVGKGPDPDAEHAHFGRRILPVATAHQAAEVINGNNIAVVPTTDVAKEALVLLGYGPLWAAFAIYETTLRKDETYLDF